MDPVNIWALNLGLKINIWPFLIHFMQPNVSLIKKLMMHIDFLGKNLYPVGRAKLSSTSVVILTQGQALPLVLAVARIRTLPYCRNRQNTLIYFGWKGAKIDIGEIDIKFTRFWVISTIKDHPSSRKLKKKAGNFLKAKTKATPQNFWIFTIFLLF